MAGKSLKIEYIDPKKLEAATYNPRSWSEKALKGLMASIAKFGICDPFIVNKRNGLRLVGGHMRCKVAIDLDIESVPIVYVDLDDNEEKALNVALNSRHISGEWDSSLGDLLGEIQADLPDLFDDLNFEDLLADVPVGLEPRDIEEVRSECNEERWKEFVCGEISGGIPPEIYELVLVEWKRIGEIRETDKVAPILEAIIANSANTPRESLA